MKKTTPANPYTIVTVSNAPRPGDPYPPALVEFARRVVEQCQAEWAAELAAAATIPGAITDAQ